MTITWCVLAILNGLYAKYKGSNNFMLHFIYAAAFGFCTLDLIIFGN